MRNVTSTITLLAKRVRAEGRAMAPIPLEKLDELGVYLRRVDKLVASVEALAGWTISVKPGEPWDTQSISMLQGVRDALEEVQS